MIATTDSGHQIDLLVVPPRTSDAVAGTAMAVAADPANTTRAPDVINAAAVTTAPVPVPNSDALPPISAHEKRPGDDGSATRRRRTDHDGRVRPMIIATQKERRVRISFGTATHLR